MAWPPDPTWTRLTTIDGHTAGEPLRIVTSGYPEIPGDTMLAKRRHARDQLDRLRRALIHEPRGHADMYACVLTDPVSDDGDVGALFLHNEGYSTMCGHAIIALTTIGLEHGLVTLRRDRGTLEIDTPAGRVSATPHRDGGRVASVSFRNVPSFVLRRDAVVDVDGIGEVRFDLAFGGAYYAYVDAASIGLSLDRAEVGRIIDAGMAIKRAVAREASVRHPSGGDDDLDFLYGTILIGPSHGDAHSKNVCIFADGEVDRSPTGTGVSGRAAIHHARGELSVGEPITITSILGTSFDVRVVEETRVGDVAAVVPEVTGSAHVTGRHELVVDPDDPLADGFLLR